jgi:hypothetical protein
MPSPPRPRRVVPRVLVRNVQCRFTEAEHARLTDAARARACTVSHLVRLVVTGRDLPPPVPARVDLDAVVELRRIGTNLNQAVRLFYARTREGQATGVANVIMEVQRQVDALTKLLT